MQHTVSPAGIVNQDIWLSGSSACQSPVGRGGKRYHIRNVGARLDEA